MWFDFQAVVMCSLFGISREEVGLVSNFNFSYLGSGVYAAAFAVVGPVVMEESGLDAVYLMLNVLLSWTLKEMKVFW